MTEVFTVSEPEPEPPPAPAPPLFAKEKYELKLALAGLLLRLLELLEADRAGPGLREAGRGFSVLILSAGLASCEVDSEVTPDRYCGTAISILAPQRGSS